MYEHDKVPQWIDSINRTIIKQIGQLQLPFKFICLTFFHNNLLSFVSFLVYSATTVIMEKKLANLHCSCSALWDNVNDGMCHAFY